MDLIYAGFDGLDVTFQGFIPLRAVELFEAAKVTAQETKQETFAQVGLFKGHVAETGARGGYTFRVDTGNLGFTWFFSKSQKREGWNIRVSCKSATLAAYGFEGAISRMYADLDAVGATVLQEAIARIDFAMDWRMPGDFRLDPHRFALHGTTKADMHGEEIGQHWQKRQCTGLTIGKMPGRQICIYDKRRDIVAKRKDEWWKIWGIDRDEFETSGDQMWRIELRAGKKHLKDQWGVTSWADLRAKLGDIYAHALLRIRYKAELWDETDNVTRIPDDEMWESCRRVVGENLFEYSSNATPGVVKQVMQEQQRQTISAMMIGLSANFAVLAGVRKDRLAELPKLISEMIANNVKGESVKEFKDKMTKVFRRYEIHDEDGVILNERTIAASQTAHCGGAESPVIC
ncbi:hypothetical protein [Thalassospira marina]|uniref:Replication initiation factor n=1 Tax=Thalassospira marina TaxID=2048283 RepID=A0A2N3KTT8_9PROT|nr:hypothetical protein [Thalassospira marina]AUG55722.1 hypothetical protein CSC3H3_23020 [Thalassospira marina]PKR53883.1 hypothetical protein COO20_12820 [Thalassospira marina]